MTKWVVLIIRVLALVLGIVSGKNQLIKEVKELVEVSANALKDGKVTREELLDIISEAKDTIVELLK